jgi:hypothetical protein
MPAVSRRRGDIQFYNLFFIPIALQRKTRAAANFPVAQRFAGRFLVLLEKWLRHSARPGVLRFLSYCNGSKNAANSVSLAADNSSTNLLNG